MSTAFLTLLMFLLSLIQPLQGNFPTCAERGYTGVRCYVYVVATMAQGATQDSADTAANAPIYEQQMNYSTSMAGYYNIGTPVTFTGTAQELWGDAAGSYAGQVVGYQLTSYANQPLSAGYTIAYIISYNGGRTAVIPPDRVNG
jgi:hypothetical protein